LNPIHEGTHGIQGLDLLGRKVVIHDGAGLRALLTSIESTVTQATALDDETKGYAQALEKVAATLASTTAALWAADDRAVTLANSSVYLEAAGHIVIAWMWLEQWLAAAGKTGAFYAGKRQATRYFFRYELPKVGPQLDLLASLDRTTLDAEPEGL
jgi:hypothetical protein